MVPIDRSNDDLLSVYYDMSYRLSSGTSSESSNSETFKDELIRVLYEATLTPSTTDVEVQCSEIPYDASILTNSTHCDNTSNHTARIFAGHCLDSSAARSAVGRNQYGELCKELGQKPKLKKSKTLLKYGRCRFASDGCFTTRLRVSTDSFMDFDVYIVNGEFPLLIGLYSMTDQELHLEYGLYRFSDSSKLYFLLIFYRQGQAFVTC